MVSKYVKKRAFVCAIKGMKSSLEKIQTAKRETGAVGGLLWRAFESCVVYEPAEKASSNAENEYKSFEILLLGAPGELGG